MSNKIIDRLYSVLICNSHGHIRERTKMIHMGGSLVRRGESRVQFARDKYPLKVRSYIYHETRKGVIVLQDLKGK